MFTTSLLLLQFSVSAMAGTVSLKSVTFPGLQQRLATDPSVQSFVAQAIGATSELKEVRGLLPYSVVIDNNTGHTIIAYTLHLSFVDADGRSGGDTRQYFNFEAESNGMEIPARTQRLVTPFWSFSSAIMPSKVMVGPSRDSAINLVARLGAQVSVATCVDLVVLDDGQVLGPDEADTLSYLQGYLTGEHDTAAVVLDSMQRGDTTEQISNHLQQLLEHLGQQESLRARATETQVRRFLALAAESRERLYNEANRIMVKAPIVLHR